MKNEHVLEQLSAYMDGEAADPRGVARHLQTCETCARRYLELRKLATQVRKLPPPVPHPAFTGRVMAHVRESQPVRHRGLRVAWALAAALLLMLGGATVYLNAPWPGAAQPAPGQLVAASKVWADEEAVVAEFCRLLDDGAVPFLVTAEAEPDMEAVDIEVEDLVYALAMEGEGIGEIEEAVWYEDDFYATIDSLDEVEAAVFEELLIAYISEG